MSRTMQQKEEKPAAAGATPILVWVVYGLGILAATIFAASLLFTLGAYLFADDVPVSANVSIPALLIWGGLSVLAGATWVRRRRR